MELEVRFTPIKEKDERLFSIIEDDGTLYHYDGADYKLKLENKDGILCLADDDNPFVESKDIVTERLIGLSAVWIESRSQGFESESTAYKDPEQRPGYGPDDIFVENKPFSLRQIVDLIDSGDIDIAPDFQRNFIWDKTRQSRLIESIFLGLPLPSIYLSQYEDGTLTVVDGLQRLSTIKRFMDDKLILVNLEYLHECNGLKYSELSSTLSPLRLRRFGQTQIMCFVIDYRSPSKLKFDLFRRLNTGGKPLNNQEIRNCLSQRHVQVILKRMVDSDEFRRATDESVRDTRMEAQESALRFMYFCDNYSDENPIGNYNGNMDDTLDAFVDQLNESKDLDKYVSKYHNSLLCAYHLFGNRAFRKITPDTINSRRAPINKLLLLVFTVLFTQYEYQNICHKYSNNYLLEPLAHLIKENQDLFNAITWSTNSKWNIETAFKIIKKKLLDVKLSEI